jgi:hypothetical protein
MPERHSTTIIELRRTIDCLPRPTRVAMLEGIETNPIIAGAYSTEGGICPMLAAHRNGGRTNFISFANAWDRFAFREVKFKSREARPATARELRVLHSCLEASLLAEVDLGAAINEHRDLVASRNETTAPSKPVTRARPGDPDRSKELRKRDGWRWMRPVRSYDEYERLVAALEFEQEAADQRASTLQELELQLEPC